ncbi:hypothetical protein [Kineothrix sedimenti]|uniref:Uncharacterized protein n=1 Tax=Kineothrix sedimenti TaxID=3123317 RepID=A0ABZ3F2W2_9FIRM
MSFIDELNKNTKTPEQVADEKWEAEKEIISNCAYRDYFGIKQALINEAQNGKYSLISNNKKCVSAKYECSYLRECIKKTCSSNPTGRIGTSNYKSNERVDYKIERYKQYNCYIDTIKNFAVKDNIKIEPSFYELGILSKETRISMPYTYKGYGVITHKIKVYLSCSIEY